MTTPRSLSSSSCVEVRAAGEVRQQVDRVHRGLGADGDVEGDEVVRGVGVQRAAEALGGVVDVAVVRVLLAALEDEVLEEVRHPVLLGALAAGAGVEGDEDRDRARPVEADAVQGKAVVQRGGGDRGHAPNGSVRAAPSEGESATASRCSRGLQLGLVLLGHLGRLVGHPFCEVLDVDGIVEIDLAFGDCPSARTRGRRRPSARSRARASAGSPRSPARPPRRGSAPRRPGSPQGSCSPPPTEIAGRS